jgi:hypothetical protein
MRKPVRSSGCSRGASGRNARGCFPGGSCCWRKDLPASSASRSPSDASERLTVVALPGLWRAWSPLGARSVLLSLLRRAAPSGASFLRRTAAPSDEAKAAEAAACREMFDGDGLIARLDSPLEPASGLPRPSARRSGLRCSERVSECELIVGDNVSPMLAIPQLRNAQERRFSVERVENMKWGPPVCPRGIACGVEATEEFRV